MISVALAAGCQFADTAFVDGFPSKEPVVESYCERNTKTFGRTTTQQFVEELDLLYADFRNRTIPFRQGVWYVANQVVGVRQARLEALLEAMRRQANE